MRRRKSASFPAAVGDWHDRKATSESRYKCVPHVQVNLQTGDMVTHQAKCVFGALVSVPPADHDGWPSISLRSPAVMWCVCW